MTTLSVGSLLDDHLWHDVKVERHERMVNLSVDRVEVAREVNGVFRQLDLNAKVTEEGSARGSLGSWERARGSARRVDVVVAVSVKYLVCVSTLILPMMKIFACYNT